MGYREIHEQAHRECYGLRDAEASLESDFLHAAYYEPDHKLQTPDFADGFGGKARMTYAEVIADAIDGDTEILESLLWIVGRLSQAETREDFEAAKLLAELWLSVRKEAYVQRHAAAWASEG